VWFVAVAAALVMAPWLRTELQAQAEQGADTYRDELAALRTGTSQLPGSGPIGRRARIRYYPAARPAGRQGRSQGPPACRLFRLLGGHGALECSTADFGRTADLGCAVTPGPG